MQEQRLHYITLGILLAAAVALTVVQLLVRPSYGGLAEFSDSGSEQQAAPTIARAQRAEVADPGRHGDGDTEPVPAAEANVAAVPAEPEHPACTHDATGAIFAPGNRWIYKVTVAPGDPRIDRTETLTHYLMWESIAVAADAAEDALPAMARVRETGGPSDRAERLRDFRFAGSLQVRGGKNGPEWEFAAAGGGGSAPCSWRHLFGDTVLVQGDAGNVGFEYAPTLGVVGWMREGSAGEGIRAELIGAVIGGRRLGDADHPVRRCDWSNSLKLTRRHPERTVRFARDGAQWTVTGTRTGFSVESDSGVYRQFSASDPSLDLVRLKHYRDPDAGTDYLLGHFESDQSAEAVTAMVFEGDVHATATRRFPALAKGEDVSTLLMQDGDACILRVRLYGPRPSIPGDVRQAWAADFGFAKGTLLDLRDNLDER